MDQPWSGRKLHFVGIGGAGMSGLAVVAHALGAERHRLRPRRRLAVRAHEAPGSSRVGHDAANVPAGAEVVYSSAIPPDNPERTTGAPELHRADLLGEITRLKPTIAVSGTHGKTTTLEHARARAGAGQTATWSAARSARTGANAGWGPGEWLVVEADESDRSLLKLSPTIAVVTNAELDHHTTYASRRDVDDTFRAFLARARDAVRAAADLVRLAPERRDRASSEARRARSPSPARTTPATPPPR